MEENHSIYPDKYAPELKPLITLDQLKAIFPQLSKNASDFIPHLNKFLPLYGINTPERISMFIAQAGHESGQFKYVKEIWGPTPQQKRYERDFSAPWTANNPTNKLAYELGNDEVGDGNKYAGKGLFQSTGKANYRTLSPIMGLQLIKYPELLQQPEYAVQSACIFWSNKRLNQYADTGDIVTCTKRINGGLTGIGQRTSFYNKAKSILMDGDA